MLQHLEAVLSVHTTFGEAVFNPAIVVARVSWMFDHVVVVRSARYPQFSIDRIKVLRRTVISFMPNDERVRPVSRLDRILESPAGAD